MKTSAIKHGGATKKSIQVPRAKQQVKMAVVGSDLFVVRGSSRHRSKDT
jgi:hypothetical protein